MMFNNMMLNTMFNMILSDGITADASIEIQYLAHCIFVARLLLQKIFLLLQKIVLLLVCLQLIARLPGQSVNCSLLPSKTQPPTSKFVIDYDVDGA